MRGSCRSVTREREGGGCGCGRGVSHQDGTRWRFCGQPLHDGVYGSMCKDTGSAFTALKVKIVAGNVSEFLGVTIVDIGGRE